MLQLEIDKMKFLLNKVISDLVLVETEEFQPNFDNAKTRMILFNKIKDNLIKEYPVEELRKYENELISLTKQIRNKFDNIVKKKKSDMATISARMKHIQNRKKLINYNE